MIEIVAASESLQEPAKSPDELFDRLSLYVGETLRVHFPLDEGGYKTRVGKLGELERTNAEGYSAIYYSFLGASDYGFEGSKLYADTESLYSVLVDSQWKLIHDGIEVDLTSADSTDH